MNKLNMTDVQKYAEEHIAIFHKERLNVVLEGLNLDKLLLHKNPYLFKAKNIFTAQQLIKSMADAFLQSGEETKFGNFIEGLAIFVCNKVYGAEKLEEDGTGMDFKFEKDGVIYVVECKAGWNWGNQSQIKQIKLNSQIAKERWEKDGKEVKIINGCCFGKKKNRAEKAGYEKICGQDFWYLISNDDELYIKIIEPIGHKAKEKNEEFEIAYASLQYKLTLEFAQRFCDDGGIIDWKKLLEFNSGRNKKK
ncbi:MAG: cytosolic protein [Prevotellaceae bacterium]|jgi:hypothetical protein|nr:cytosolic protein [Prevotellaceae bacterium]